MSQSANWRYVLRLALPLIVANVTSPLLGLVDTAVIGRLGDPVPLGAVALGALVFTFVSWTFGFLRMGTSGMTAQALGAERPAEVQLHLVRALLLAGGVGVLLVLLAAPLSHLAFYLLNGSAKVEALAGHYVAIRIWAAPATLCNMALIGWFIGLGRTRVTLLLQVILNLTNVLLDVWFVTGLGWGAAGVAWGTLLSEWGAAGLGLALAARHLVSLQGGWSLEAALRLQPWLEVCRTNRDILVRTFSLLLVFAWFTSEGAALGDLTLAANAVLLQLVNFSAFFLDGVAAVAESLVGQRMGARNRRGLEAVLRTASGVSGCLAALLTVFYLVGGPWLIRLLTTSTATQQAAAPYLFWAAFAPVVGVWSFVLDGAFIGATRGRDLRNGMLIALGFFAAARWLLQGYGNHGLWASLYVHYVLRTLTLLRRIPALLEASHGLSNDRGR